MLYLPLTKSVFAEEVPSHIVGRVIDQQQNPVVYGKITFQNESTNLETNVYTDIDGSYQISVPDGIYSITIRGSYKNNNIQYSTSEKVDGDMIKDFSVEVSTKGNPNRNSDVFNQNMLIVYPLIIVPVLFGVMLFVLRKKMR